MNATAKASLDYPLDALRAQFPALQQSVHGRPLAYLDNAATTQKPESVLAALNHYYRHDNANVHRAIHALSARATHDYEGARDKVQAFIGAARREEVIFTRGTTESINLVAQSFARPRFGPGDEILITQLEHHSNIVPWQLVCEQTGAILRFAPVDDQGALDMQAFRQLLGERTRLVAVAESSNAIGTRNPIAELTRLAHAADCPILVDAAQGVPHRQIDVETLGVDFMAFSSHKMYGPTGIGVLYGREKWLEAMPPWQGGGDMIETVSLAGSTWNSLPYKFEAGTPNIAGAIGLGAAVDFLEQTGLEQIAAHEHALLQYGTRRLQEVDGLHLIGTAADKVAILSFIMDGMHAHDIGTLLDEEGIAVRTGHHCAMPLMARCGVAATARASLACYNSHAEIDCLIDTLHRIRRLFKI